MRTWHYRTVSDYAAAKYTQSLDFDDNAATHNQRSCT